MDFDKLITLTVEENEKCKTEILRHKTKMVEKPTCAICSINTANCDCDKCGVWGCYDCVANKNDEYNICDKCDCEEEEEPYCFKDTTIDTVENDICFCSVGGCVKPTEFD
tara:strand:- start:10368 stop:10697 length:330 start_codon:yes stop_codon:yes gene_type:complete